VKYSIPKAKGGDRGKFGYQVRVTGKTSQRESGKVTIGKFGWKKTRQEHDPRGRGIATKLKARKKR